MPITNSLTIAADELGFRFTRSSGPGGQHVNRSATQVELLFDVAHSPSLSEEQRMRIGAAMARRIDREGVLHLTSSGSRSQHQNREEVVARFRALLQRALHVPPSRRPTLPSRTAREKRLAQKRRRGAAKFQRGRVTVEE